MIFSNVKEVTLLKKATTYVRYPFNLGKLNLDWFLSNFRSGVVHKENSNQLVIFFKWVLF